MLGGVREGLGTARGEPYGRPPATLPTDALARLVESPGLSRHLPAQPFLGSPARFTLGAWTCTQIPACCRQGERQPPPSPPQV